jgi:hypothetical protein
MKRGSGGEEIHESANSTPVSGGSFPLRASASAQSVGIPCGGIVQTPNTSSQLGSNLWVVYTVGTSVPFNVCVVGVMVDAHVAGRSGQRCTRTGSGRQPRSVRSRCRTPGHG